jgi:hypothetical protein
VGTAQEAISGVMSIIVYAVIVFAVVKIYAISVEVSEIKELLRDIKRNTEDRLPPAFAAQAVSPESLVRAVHASSYPDPGYPDSEVEEARSVAQDIKE